MKVVKPVLKSMSCLVFSLFIMSGASSGTVFGASVGILYTTESENQTRLLYLDEELRPTGEEMLPYSNISFGGYENECRTEHYLFLNPKGETGFYDAGTVLRMNPVDLSFTTFPIDRVNITSFTSDEAYIYTLSNLNQVTCADRLSLTDSSLDTVKIEGIYLDSAAVVDGKLYTFAYGDDDLCDLCCVDFEQSEVEHLLNLDSNNPPCFLIAYEKNLLFTYSGVLYTYDTVTGILTEKDLVDERAYNLSLSGDILAIGYTSILSMEDSRMELYDLKEGKSLCQFEHPGSILQIEMPRQENGDIYVLGYDGLTVYHFEENAATGIEAAAVRSFSLEPENTEYCGGFVLLN